MTVGALTTDVVMLASLGRPASDFDDLADRLRDGGLTAHPFDPPPSWDGEPTLHDLAGGVIAEMDRLGIECAHIIGHAFGNRLARTVTADHPSRVATLTLLAAGGYVPIEPSIGASLLACFDESLSAAEHLTHVSRAFFAPGNDARVWADGWMSAVAAYQRPAIERTPRTDWWDAVADRVFVIQALQDVIAVPENGRRYVREHINCAELVEIDGAGHAMLPEQPRIIAEAVLRFLHAESGDTVRA